MEKKLNPISFKEVAHLVNHIPGTRIDVERPLISDPNQYAAYPGSVSSSGFSFSFEILYLYADATKEGIANAKAWLNRKNDKSKVKVVYASSTRPSIVDELRLPGVDCISLADYFLSFIKTQTETYINKINALVFPNYINPQIETPVGNRRKSPNPVLEFLAKFDEDEKKGGIAVLLGEPGQGKTHMSKYLISELIKKKKSLSMYIQNNGPQCNLKIFHQFGKLLLPPLSILMRQLDWLKGLKRNS